MGDRTINIFAEKSLEDLFQSRINHLISEIEGEKDTYLLNVNEEDYASHLKQRYELENVDLLFDDKSVSSSERYISAELFPFDFVVYTGKKYKKDVIKYHIPFSGDSYLLRCFPNTHINWSHPVEMEGNEITFEIINFRNDPEEIKNRSNEITNSISQQLGFVQGEVDGFNSRLDSIIRQHLQARKEKILKKLDILSKLNVPLRKNPNVPQTFSIPKSKVQKKLLITKPTVLEKEFHPEPTLDDSVYQSILSVIHDVGKQFERMPSTYKDKEEEHLRDHFLLYLEPNFEGSATGETFNRIGKTDILLKYEGKNVFISECKFWKGEKSFLKTIDQLLGYLTWRDSKSSVVIFVENKDFSSVLEKVKQIIKTHSCYVNYINQKDETWFNYVFHLPDDLNRKVMLAVQLFHIPK